MNMDETLVPYSRAAIHLLRGIVYDDQVEVWRDIMEYQEQLIAYFTVIRLELCLFEADGYAFLRDPRKIDGVEGDDLPSLVDTRKLSYMDTLLCVVFRKKVLQEDKGSGEKITIKEQEIIDAIRIYYPELPDQVKGEKRILAAIKHMEEYRFINKLNHEEYEIRRIIKARIAASQLDEIEALLKAHHQTTKEEH